MTLSNAMAVLSRMIILPGDEAGATLDPSLRCPATDRHRSPTPRTSYSCARTVTVSSSELRTNMNLTRVLIVDDNVAFTAFALRGVALELQAAEFGDASTLAARVRFRLDRPNSTRGCDFVLP